MRGSLSACNWSATRHHAQTHRSILSVCRPLLSLVKVLLSVVKALLSLVKALLSVVEALLSLIKALLSVVKASVGSGRLSVCWAHLIVCGAHLIVCGYTRKSPTFSPPHSPPLLRIYMALLLTCRAIWRVCRSVYNFETCATGARLQQCCAGMC